MCYKFIRREVWLARLMTLVMCYMSGSSSMALCARAMRTLQLMTSPHGVGYRVRVSLVPRHPIFRARPAALSKNRVWTRSLRKLGHVYIWRMFTYGACLHMAVSKLE